MPKNINTVNDISHLQTIPAPVNSGSLEHKDIADMVILALAAEGYKILGEEYRISVNQDVVQGLLHLEHTSINEFNSGICFVWVNSYDRTTGFHCDMGVYGRHSQHSEIYIELEPKNFRRNSTDLVKHTNSYIQDRVKEGLNNFKEFSLIRDKFKTINLDTNEVCSMVGYLYLKDFISSSQLVNLKTLIKSNLNQYPTVWNMLKILSNTFEGLHPKLWFKNQIAISNYLIDRYLIETTEVKSEFVDPAQTNLLTMIEEIESTNNTLDNIEPIVEDEQPKVLNLSDYDAVFQENKIVEHYEVLEVVEPEVSVFPVNSYDMIEEIVEQHIENEITEFPKVPDNIPVFTLNQNNESNIQKSDCSESGGESDSNESQTEEVCEDTVGDIISNTENLLVHTLEENNKEVVPLEEQVAMSEVQPVSEEELEISSKPVVNQPIMEELSSNMNSEYDSKEKTLESPNFEF